ncbi:MAG TPA: hypothetical protein VEA41_12390 [Salinarimonas sp.]|nr:hypothetical protein [Salinarimonas sp.]
MRWPVLPSTRALRVLAWLLLALVAAATLCPIELRPASGLSVNRERFMAFALVGGAFSLAYPRRRALVIALLLGSAAALEVLQHLAPGRHGEVRDAVIKAAGGLLGCLAGVAADRLLPRGGEATSTVTDR